MSASWIVNVAGRTYGPYSDGQMTAFAAEGRLTGQSLIARNGESNFRPAREEPELARLFPESVEPLDAAEQEMRMEPRSGSAFGRSKDEAPKSGERSHVIIVADMKSRSISGLEEEIHKLGQACPIVPQVWLLRTDQSISSIRNLLIQQLGSVDRLFVADATNNKAAWFNFGPESEARIRRLWSRDQSEQAKLQAAG